MSALPSPAGGLRGVFGRAVAVLLDFDGPICGVFTGLSDREAAQRLVAVLARHSEQVPGDLARTRDPFDVLRHVTDELPALAREVEEALRVVEVEAVMSAAPTPHAAEVMRCCGDTGRKVAVVSNNSAAAVVAYLRHHDLLRLVDVVSAREPGDEARLKPNPHLVHQACQRLRVESGDCVLVGDSATDVQAAHTAGVPAIGYADKPGKGERLRQAGADAVVVSMAELVTPDLE
ncbi:HAD family hydrolase [Streptoalloteichus hindustanus]|uniref:Haloacid dehalogenase superfamily, subfamily IA, variant 3 with third motif having DD or ED/haloacid dehalogenase superfamily, subfamily IA, variant 1 with third motif having Dx(3-4)D or Dx(3-4)E n=1 Tax=Streptoalloteichus hindustanus TaxID=2017 RepID=A0A1M5Q6B1_STRHI|nr:haloacid dehalogenase superfamily, subfamily IA, variant 3 with third motif having DD or ED/haloacid dehalogenase superfamily, subfamily IA, variant 1 with third motif having Dx(3-4)D or Dx(3-4)E [Streptoalloteichus hindustanus]